MRNKDKDPQRFDIDKINFELVCPMNCVRQLNVGRKKHDDTIPFMDLIIRHELHPNDQRRKSRKVEWLIEKYMLQVKDSVQCEDEYDEVSLLLREDFDNLIEDIRTVKISHNYKGLMHWLICRGFMIGKPGQYKKSMESRLYKNRPILLKVLYEVNSKAFLECFTKEE